MILKAVRRNNQFVYKGKHIRIIAHVSAALLNVRKARVDLSQALKGNDVKPRVLYPAELSFKIDGEISTFQEKNQLITIKPTLQKTYKGVLYTEEEQRQSLS